MAWVEKMAHGSLYPNFAGQDIPPKSPVTDQAEPGVFERCRLVVLKKEVADPGECISLDEPYRNEPPPLRGHGGDEQRQSNTRAGEMQPSAGAVGVLAQVKGVEVAEGPKRVLVVHWQSPRRYASPSVRPRDSSIDCWAKQGEPTPFVLRRKHSSGYGHRQSSSCACAPDANLHPHRRSSQLLDAAARNRSFRRY